MAQSYDKTNRCDSAIKYYKINQTYKDTLHSLDSEKNIAMLHTQYETEKKEQQIKLLSQETDLQKADLTQKRIIIYAALAGLVLLLLLALPARTGVERINEEIKARESGRFRLISFGSPAIRRCTLVADRWLCALPFRRVCLRQTCLADPPRPVADFSFHGVSIPDRTRKRKMLTARARIRRLGQYATMPSRSISRWADLEGSIVAA